MYNKILIATDGSELAERAVAHGLSLAKEQNADVVIVTVTESWLASEMASQMRVGTVNPIEHLEKTRAVWAEKVLTAAGNQANELGLNCETVHIKDQHPAIGILNVAKSKQSELIVMASHGRRGLNKMLLGSIANEVVSQSAVPVLIYR